MAKMKNHTLEPETVTKARSRPEPTPAPHPHPLAPHNLLHLQRTIGNQAVGRLLNRSILVQRDIDDDVDALRRDLKTSKDELLRKILTEVLATHGSKDVTTRYGPSIWESEATKKKTGDYEAVIDESQISDPTQRQSYIVHELTHISADKKYDRNAGGGKFENVVDDPMKSEAYIKLQLDYMGNLVEQAADAITKEELLLGKGLADYLVNRLGRAVNTITEFDTVSAELYYYINKQKVNPSTKTYQLIRQMAEGSYKRRTEGTAMLPPQVAKKDGCFITTACTAAMGLPDDCDELNTLRAFRDGYVAGLPFGPALIAEYYELAPGLVAQIESRPDSPTILAQLYQEITTAVQLIKAGRPEAALTCYRDNVLALQAQVQQP